MGSTACAPRWVYIEGSVNSYFRFRLVPVPQSRQWVGGEGGQVVEHLVRATRLHVAAEAHESPDGEPAKFLGSEGCLKMRHPRLVYVPGFRITRVRLAHSNGVDLETDGQLPEREHRSPFDLADGHQLGDLTTGKPRADSASEVSGAGIAPSVAQIRSTPSRWSSKG